MGRMRLQLHILVAALLVLRPHPLVVADHSFLIERVADAYLNLMLVPTGHDK
jgi:hypothetical protein